jgi:hypothetical protein
MSLFQATTLNCPSCGEPAEFEAVQSVNADRRADLRDQILAGTFQRQVCVKCGLSFRLQPMMTYLDQARGQWIAAFPYEDLAGWQARDAQAADAFARSFGAQASVAAQDLGKELRPRLTFGWHALTEKLLVRERGLDDATIELMKLALIRGRESSPVLGDTELRVLEIDAESFELSWLFSTTGEVAESLHVPRDLYDEIRADEDGDWAELRDAFKDKLFVDIATFMVPGDEPAAA